MNYLDFKETLLNRRSIRKYTEKDVLKEDIIDIIECASYAPSDTNSQTWEFIVITDKEKIIELANITKSDLEKESQLARDNGKIKEGNLLERSFGNYITFFKNAPVLIICLTVPYASKFRDRIFDPIGLLDNNTWAEEEIKSSSLACENLMLAAHAKGLGTCPITGPLFLAKDSIRKYLNIDDHKHINMIITLGYPDESPKAPKRKNIEDILTFI